MGLDAEALARHLGAHPAAADVLAIWEAAAPAVHLAYRACDEVLAYLAAFAALRGRPLTPAERRQALDEQLRQKVLPRLRAGQPGLEEALRRLADLAGPEEAPRYPLAHAWLARQLELHAQTGTLGL